MLVRTALAMVACLAIVASASAQRSKLTVGDNAPGIDIETWFNGDAVAIEPGQVYVVEFWATWCAPCRKSIPHINELSQKYAGKGLRVIGVSSDDKSSDIVQKFVVSQGDRMSYLVGVDRKGNTKKAWMEAAGQNGIPCAFVVDRGGKVVFIGHPLDEQFERAVKMTIRGKFDPKKEKQAEPLLAAAERAVRVKNYREAYKYFDEVIAMDPVLFSRVAQRKFQVLLVDENDPTRAWAYAKQMLQTYSGDPETLRDAAVDIATNPLYKEPNLDIALAAAEAALAIQGTSSADALATVALVRFHRNELDQAVERQMEAWMVAVPAAKDDYKRTLEKYRSAAERTAKLN
ncbi:MAG: redoxin family protein [Phycisphaerales bacterium]|nr:redoxin family protein [Phycisphaerales bacterium]